MSYDYQGIASVITASRHIGTPSDEHLNESVSIQLTSSGKPTIARLSFDKPCSGQATPILSPSTCPTARRWVA